MAKTHLIRTSFLVAITYGAVLGLAGCASDGTARNTSHLDVTATPGTPTCSPTSPELQVYGTPHAAEYYRVRLIDLSDPAAKHGEGEVSVNPEGVIPAGTLADGYTPVCAGTGGHSYQYEVHAVDNLGRVLGTGAYVVTM